MTSTQNIWAGSGLKFVMIAVGFRFLISYSMVIIIPYYMLIITGQTIVGPSDYILLVVFLFMNRSRSSPRPIRASDIPNCSDLLWVEIAAL